MAVGLRSRSSSAEAVAAAPQAVHQRRNTPESVPRQAARRRRPPRSGGEVLDRRVRRRWWLFGRAPQSPSGGVRAAGSGRSPPGASRGPAPAGSQRRRLGQAASGTAPGGATVEEPRADVDDASARSTMFHLGLHRKVPGWVARGGHDDRRLLALLSRKPAGSRWRSRSGWRRWRSASARSPPWRVGRHSIRPSARRRPEVSPVSSPSRSTSRSSRWLGRTRSSAPSGSTAPWSEPGMVAVCGPGLDALRFGFERVTIGGHRIHGSADRTPNQGRSSGGRVTEPTTSRILNKSPSQATATFVSKSRRSRRRPGPARPAAARPRRRPGSPRRPHRPSRPGSPRRPTGRPPAP